MEYTEGFIKSTAKDYCMPINDVYKIANKQNSWEDFYQALEKHLENRIKGEA